MSSSTGSTRWSEHRSARSRTDSAVHLLAQLAAGELDLVLVAEFDGAPLAFPAQARNVVIVEREPALVAMAEDHPLASRDPLRLGDLADQWWAVQGSRRTASGRPSPPPAGRPGSCRGCGTSRTTSAWPAGRHVGAGRPDGPAAVLRAGGDVLRALEGEPLHRRLHLAWRPDRVPVPSQELLAAVRAGYAAHTAANEAFARWWAAHGWGPPIDSHRSDRSDRSDAPPRLLRPAGRLTGPPAVPRLTAPSATARASVIETAERDGRCGCAAGTWCGRRSR